jgi:hypothetical protein
VTLLEKVLARLRAEMISAGKVVLFDALKAYLGATGTDLCGDGSQSGHDRRAIKVVSTASADVIGICCARRSPTLWKVLTKSKMKFVTCLLVYIRTFSGAGRNVSLPSLIVIGRGDADGRSGSR